MQSSVEQTISLLLRTANREYQPGERVIVVFQMDGAERTASSGVVEGLLTLNDGGRGNEGLEASPVH